MTTTATPETAVCTATRTDLPRLPRDVERHGHYLFEHLSRQEIAEFVALEVGPGELVPLHQVGCTPEQLAAYREAGLPNNRSVMRLRAAGWSPEYLAATGLEPQLALDYLSCGITNPVKMRRLAAAGAPPSAIAPHIAPNAFCSTIASAAPLPCLTITVDGAFGSLPFVIEHGLLDAASPDVADDLQDEMAMTILGHEADSSPALRLYRHWRRGMHADWDDLATIVGTGDSGDVLRLRWLRAVLDAAHTRFDGHTPDLPRLAPPPPCPACIERAEFVRVREDAYHASVQTPAPGRGPSRGRPAPRPRRAAA